LKKPNITAMLCLAAFSHLSYAQNNAFDEYSQTLVLGHYSCSLNAERVWIANELDSLESSGGGNLLPAYKNLHDCISLSESKGNAALKKYFKQSKGRGSAAIKRLHASWLAALRALQPQSSETMGSHSERRATAYGKFQDAKATAEVDLLQ
jgi:hypothetical protein